VFDRFHEFLGRPVALDREPAILDCEFEVSRREGADEDHFFCVLADVDEATSARKPWSELRDVEIALSICLRQPEHGEIQSATIVKIELVGLIYYCLWISGSTKVQPSCGHSAHDAGLRGQRDQVEHFLFVGDVRNTLRHADTEVHNGIRLKFHCRAPGDYLATAHRHWLDRTQRHAHLASEGRTVLCGKGLCVIVWARNDDAIDEDAGNLDLPGVEPSTVRDPLDLSDDHAPGVVRSHGNRERFEG